MSIITIDGANANDFSASWLFLSHADDIFLRIDDFWRIIVHIGHNNMNGYSGASIWRSLIASFRDQIVRRL